MKVTVVVCTRRRPALLKRCLSAVSQLKPAPTQVIVVDNSSGDSDTKNVAQTFGARYTVEPNAGLSHARKRGLAECETEAVAFLEDDAIPEPDWLVVVPASSERKKSTESAPKVLNIASKGRKPQKLPPSGK